MLRVGCSLLIISRLLVGRRLSPPACREFPLIDRFGEASRSRRTWSSCSPACRQRGAEDVAGWKSPSRRERGVLVLDFFEGGEGNLPLTDLARPMYCKTLGRVQHPVFLTTSAIEVATTLVHRFGRSKPGGFRRRIPHLGGHRRQELSSSRAGSTQRVMGETPRGLVLAPEGRWLREGSAGRDRPCSNSRREPR